jgi:hypothetical protein
MEHIVGDMFCRLVSPISFDRFYPGTGNRCLSRFRPCCCSKCVCLKFWRQRKCPPGHAATDWPDMARHGETSDRLLRCFQPGETMWKIWNMTSDHIWPHDLGALVHPSPTLTVSSASKIIKGLSSIHFKNIRKPEHSGHVTIWVYLQKKHPAPSVGKPSC